MQNNWTILVLEGDYVKASKNGESGTYFSGPVSEFNKISGDPEVKSSFIPSQTNLELPLEGKSLTLALEDSLQTDEILR
jgi:hypothetical protein